MVIGVLSVIREELPAGLGYIACCLGLYFLYLGVYCLNEKGSVALPTC